MISIHAEFLPVIAALPTGPVAGGPVTHPRISIYAATAVEDDVPAVQEMVAAIAGGAWEAEIARVDADLRLYELAVETPSTLLDEAEIANLIGYGMTTVEVGIDLLGVAALPLEKCHPRAGGDPGGTNAFYEPGSSACAEDDTFLGRSIPALFGAIIAARMAGIRVVLSGPAALAARDLLQALNPDAVGHCLEAGPGDMANVFGLTGAIALLQAEP